MSWVKTKNSAAAGAALLLLSACQTLGSGADYLGSYMPVIGERCEHWQCFTTEGKTISEAKRKQREEGDGEAEEKDDDDDADEANAAQETGYIEPVIPPSTESGIPDVQQRGSRKPFPQAF